MAWPAGTAGTVAATSMKKAQLWNHYQLIKSLLIIKIISYH